jgi:flagellar biosynthesis protein
MRRAVALRYEGGRDEAPVVTARGQGLVADKILALARANAVPVREDSNLVQVLSLLDLDEQIPQHAYRAVAEILAFLYRVNGAK